MTRSPWFPVARLGVGRAIRVSHLLDSDFLCTCRQSVLALLRGRFFLTEGASLAMRANTAPSTPALSSTSTLWSALTDTKRKFRAKGSGKLARVSGHGEE